MRGLLREVAECQKIEPVGPSLSDQFLGLILNPLHVRCLGGGSSSPTSEVLDRHKNTCQQHKNVSQDDHHRVDRDRLLGHVQINKEGKNSTD